MDLRSHGYGARYLALATGLCLMATSLLVPSRRAEASVGGNCPNSYDHDTLAGGEHAVGWTVSSGQTPEPFEVEILGVLQNGIAPDRDLIIVDTSGPAIDAAGGIWAGMSGSPVFIGTDLVGAVAYGFSLGPSSIGGVTPADDMEDILDYGNPAPAETRPLDSVALPRSFRKIVAWRESISPREGTSLERLMLPLAISGVSSDRLDVVNKAFKKAKAPFFAVPSGSSPSLAASEPVTGTLDEGDNLAAALSYGDVTSAAIGTATSVCDGNILGFGHPFFFSGATLMGANEATALAIVDDPTFGPFKLAGIGDVAGIVDQDRLAGIRIDTSTGPSTIPVTSDITSLDTNAQRDGETDAIRPEDVPFLATVHLLSNLDSVFDRIGDGSSSVSFTIDGTRDEGAPFTLTRTNLYSSESDITFESILELDEYLFRLSSTDLEDVEFTSVDITASVTSDVNRYDLRTLESRVGGGIYKQTKVLKVKPGQRVHLRATLEPSDGSPDVTVELSLKLPENLGGVGEIGVSGGGSGGLFCFEDGCNYEGSGPGNAEALTFDDLLDQLATASTNNELTATLRSGRRLRVTAESSAVLDRVISGSKRLRLKVKGGHSGASNGGKPPGGASERSMGR